MGLHLDPRSSRTGDRGGVPMGSLASSPHDAKSTDQGDLG
jgi:hypothetical protein